MSGNEKFVFEPGNQWPKDSEVAPFFGFPSWWRRFIFQILTPREIAVYLYLCSVMDNNAVAYPTIEQIAEEMGVESRATVKNALETLTRRGFLLRSERLNRGRKMYVYQRPAVQHTLLALLDPQPTEKEPHPKPLLDARLFPKGNPKRSKPSKASDSVVDAALRRLLKPNFNAYAHMRDGDAEDARLFLVGLLKEKMEQRTLEATQQVRADVARRLVQRDLTKWAETLPENLRELFLRTIPESEKVPF